LSTNFAAVKPLDWFIFPQLAGLGHSAMAQRFAIASREEAVAYLGHGILGSRLRECTALVNVVEGQTIFRGFSGTVASVSSMSRRSWS
jgi:uncharacterized protein (DUF1810 family)